MNKKIFNHSKRKSPLLWIYLLIGFVATITLVSMGYIFHLGNSMIAEHSPLADAVMEIKLKATTGHLWFEEIISGDVDEDLDDVLSYIDQADWYAQAMLEGDESSEVKFVSLRDPHLRQEITEVRTKLADFRKITIQRWQTRETSGIGSEIDQKYDAIFKDFIAQADMVETDLQQLIKQQFRGFQIIQIVLVVICLSVTVVVGIAFSRFVHRQIANELELQAANQQLNASNQQLDASNQQLRASEQQLKAANQQLQAHEQQLNAANQQLKAFNQQLIATEQQLSAANQQLRGSEKDLKQTNHKLGERVKELDCLYGLSLLAERGDIALGEVFQGLVELIPPGWQYPEITSARITFEGQRFKTNNFRETAWIQSSDIKVHGQKAGSIEVCYLKKRPVIDEGPFLKEERNLLSALAERMGSIIEHKQAEKEILNKQEQLRALASSLSSIEEKERKHIAEGIHDSLIQPLVFLDVKVESLLKATKDNKMIESFGQMRTILAELIKKSRTFTFDLSYPILYELGLEVAIEEWLRTEIKDKHEMAVEFRAETQTKDLDQSLTTFLFKSIKELLINVVKHAKANNVKVSVAREPNNIVLCVEDDGCGFDCDSHRIKQGELAGFGLFNIRERLTHLGGNFNIQSKPGVGSEIVLTVPLESKP